MWPQYMSCTRMYICSTFMSKHRLTTVFSFGVLILKRAKTISTTPYYDTYMKLNNFVYYYTFINIVTIVVLPLL